MLRLNSPLAAGFRAMMFTLSVAGFATTVSAATSEWVQGEKTKARLIASRGPNAEGGELFAFVDIELAPGWKTYWRTPGDAGGLPPMFDWSKSENVAATGVMFPAPELFTDRSGNTIGYKDGVTLPVGLRLSKEGAPAKLVLELSYGVCKDVCIPIDLQLSLDVPAEDATAMPFSARQALDAVPRAQNALKADDPVIGRAESDLDGAAPRIVIEGRFPEGNTRADAFLEAEGNVFLPLPVREGESTSGAVVFEAKLGADTDLKALSGKLVTITLVGDAGASFATFIAK